MNATLHLLRQTDHISVASIVCFLTCPQKYFYRYVEKKQPQQRSPNLIFGSSTHETLAFMLNAIKNTGEKPSIPELQNVFERSWKEELARPITVAFKEPTDAIKMLEYGKKAIEILYQQFPVPSQIIASEEAFSVSLPGLNGKRIVGALDLVGESANHKFVITEFKTSRSRWSQTRVDTDLQVTCYAAIAPFIGLQNVELQLVVLVKNKTPVLQIYHPQRTAKDHAEFVLVAEHVTRAIRASAFFRNRGPLCASCEYASYCK